MIAYITICIATIVSFINLLAKTSVEVEGKKNLKKPTRAGWALLIISVISLVIAISSKVSERNKAELQEIIAKHKSDSATAQQKFNRFVDSIKDAQLYEAALSDLELSKRTESLTSAGKASAEKAVLQGELIYQMSQREAERLRKENKQQKRMMLGEISSLLYFRLNLSTDVAAPLTDSQRYANWDKARAQSGAPSSLFFTDSTDRIILFPGYASKKLPSNERIGYFEIQSADRFSFYSRISFYSNSTIKEETHLYGAGGVPAWREYQWDFARFGPKLEINASSTEKEQKVPGVQLYDLLENHPLAIELHYELRGTASQKEMLDIKKYWETHFREMNFLFGFDERFERHLVQAMTLERIEIANGNMTARWVKSGEAQYETRK